jgi:hypothetical protein
MSPRPRIMRAADTPVSNDLVVSNGVIVVLHVLVGRYEAQHASMGAHLDCFCYVLGGIAWVAAGFRLGPLPYVLGAVLFHLAAAYLSFHRLEMYMRYRTIILLATKISNAIVGNYQSPVWQVCTARPEP